MKERKFSVIIPAYNAGAFLSDAVDSVLTQTESDFEILLVDDGSDEKNAERYDRLSERDSRIRVFHKKNQGTLSAREFGISKATGTYLVFLDADDLLKENALSVLAARLKETKADAVIYGYERLEGRVVRRPWVTHRRRQITEKRNLFLQICFDSRYSVIWRMCIRRDRTAGRDVTGFLGVRIGEDFIQLLSMLNRCESVLFLPDRLYRYRKTAGSVMGSIDYGNYRIDHTPRIYSLKLIKKTGIFTAKDLRNYRRYCRKVFARELVRVLGSSTDRKKKRELLERFRVCSWYQGFLSKERCCIGTGLAEAVCLWLFEREREDLLITYCTFVNLVRRKL